MKRFLLHLLLAAGFTGSAQSNYALSFAGDSFVDCGNSSSFNANTIRTMECFVKFNNLTGSQEILSKSIGGQGIELLLHNNTLSAYFMRDGGNYSFIAYPSSNLQTGVWYHVAITWDGIKENIRLYVNGLSVGARTDAGNINLTGLTNPSGNFYIGNWADPFPRMFNGSIEEVRVWNVSRTAAQIKAGMFQTDNHQTGLIAYYKMDEGSGTIISSSTATNGIAGEFVDSPVWVTSPVAKNTNAINFDGLNDYVSLGTSSTLKFTTAVTEELWVKSANWAVSSQEQITSLFASGGYGITLTTDGMINFMLMTTGTTSYRGASYSVSNLVNDTWYHVAGTFDGRYIRLYINGSLVATNDIGTSGNTIKYPYPGSSFMVGVDAGTGTAPDNTNLYFAGELDELRLWNTARTQSQIQSSMNGEIDPSDATQTSGLVSYYTFNQGDTYGNNDGLVNAIDQQGTNNGVLVGFALAGTTSNFVTQKTNLAVLPVASLSFSARVKGSGVDLNWHTAHEQNTRHFILQHSTDIRTWSNIATVTAAGSSSNGHNYSFTHMRPFAGNNFYRLNLVDNDGKSSYSPVKKVAVNAHATLLSTTITDNFIRLHLGSPARISIYSLDGRVLVQKQLPAGPQALNVQNLARGIYFLVTNEQTEKIILQ